MARLTSGSIPVRVLLLSLALVSRASAGPATPEPLRHHVRFPAPHTHYAEIEVKVPVAGRDSIELTMATWTPGSYLLREYARHIESLVIVRDASRTPLRKSSKNRWRVRTKGRKSVTLAYRLYCRVMSVRSNWVDRELAVLNGAPTFLTIVGDDDRPHEVTLELLAHWTRSVSPLPALDGGGPNAYLAKDYDTLVDSPILAGNPSVYPFIVSERPHLLVQLGDSALWNGAKAADDVAAIVRATHELWGDVVPYSHYSFLNVIVENGGGLEHSTSTLMMTSRWSFRDRDRYVGWLGLVSHEFFHTWNVKSMRPKALVEYDFENEQYTDSLWIAEGITSYYDNVLLARAGLLSRKEYLDLLSKDIDRLQKTPGRLVQTLSDSSFDTWVKFYRSNENSSNTTVSYYTKGAVVAFLLDARIRAASGGEKSLDDVMRRLYARYSGKRGYTPKNFRNTASAVAGADLSAFFARALDSTDELDYSEALELYGLSFGDAKVERTKSDEAKSGETKSGETRADEKKASAKAWLGFTSRTSGDRLLVGRVPRGTPAYRDGLNVDDEIIAIDGYRVTANAWSKRMSQYRPGEAARLLIARRGRVEELGITFGEAPKTSWKLRLARDASESQKATLESWIGQSSQ